jgi:glycine dehydrogenase
MNEYEYLNHLRALGRKNKLYKSFIGMGYYDTITAVSSCAISSKTRLVHLLHTFTGRDLSWSPGSAAQFPDHVSELTGLPVANASLLDEATAAAEAMVMFYRSRSRQAVKQGANVFFVSHDLLRKAWMC